MQNLIAILQNSNLTDKDKNIFEDLDLMPGTYLFFTDDDLMETVFIEESTITKIEQVEDTIIVYTRDEEAVEEEFSVMGGVLVITIQ